MCSKISLTGSSNTRHVLTSGTLFAAMLFAAMLLPSARANAGEKEVRGLRLTPKAFRAAVDRVLPSIVTIETYGGVAQRTGGKGGIRKPGEGPTTGIIISPDGYILTSTFSFVKFRSEKLKPIITVVMPNGTKKIAKLLGRDEARKLCILKIDGVTELPVPKFAPRGDLRVGQWSIAVGVGYGARDPAVSVGIVSATSRMQGRAVQTDANTSPANYGGPLLDIEGRVIGICVPLSPRSKDVAAGVQWYDSGIGFAIPLDGAGRIVTLMKQGAIVKPGMLGVQIIDAEPIGSGVKVGQVLGGSGSEKAGIKTDDIILSVDGRAAPNSSHLRIVMGRYVVGDRVKVRLKRGDNKIELEVALQEGKPPAKKSKKPADKNFPRPPEPPSEKNFPRPPGP